MDSYEFEKYIALLWEAQGWQTEVLQQSNDYGVDIRAVKSDPVPLKCLIQVKRYGPDNKVGGPEIQQYASLLLQEPDTDLVIVVTSSKFTYQAKDLAQTLNVKLVDGNDILEMQDRGVLPHPEVEREHAWWMDFLLWVYNDPQEAWDVGLGLIIIAIAFGVIIAVLLILIRYGATLLL